MKKFLVKLLLFSIALLLLLYPAQWIVDGGLRSLRNDDVYGDWNRIFAGEVDVDVAILGNSRAWVHINPDSIKSISGMDAYNLGVDGSDVYLQRAKWLSYLVNNKAPKYVIQNIELMAIDKSCNLYGKEQYLPFLKAKEVYGVVSQFDENIDIENRLPFVKYRGYSTIVGMGAYTFFFNGDMNRVSLKSKGFQAINKVWDNYDIVFKRQLASDTIRAKNFTVDRNEALKCLISECKELNIHLIFIHTPLYHEILQIIPQQQAFLDYFNQLAQDPDIEFWDFSIMKNLSYNRDYFYNATHLNYKGAAILSDSIAHRLKRLDAARKL